jgi:hypothetical protein
MSQQVVIVRNPTRTLALVHAGGRVVGSTDPGQVYVGLPLAEAVMGAISVLRYRLGSELNETGADGYPEVIEL